MRTNALLELKIGFSRKPKRIGKQYGLCHKFVTIKTLFFSGSEFEEELRFRFEIESYPKSIKGRILRG